jgi:hypothetical protein
MAKSLNRPRRSNDELRRASLAIQYELISLYSAYDFAEKANVGWMSDDRAKAFSNVCVHSMLLAARSLLAFLYSHNPRESDIIAEDFFDDPTVWQATRVVPSPEMADGLLMTRISKHLAHLTWDRAEDTKTLWGGFRIVWSIVLALASFCNLVDEQRVHEALRTDVGLMKVMLQAVLNQHPEWAGFMAPSLDSMHFNSIAYFGDENTAEDDDDDSGSDLIDDRI